jgi:hypothetical protein
MVDCAWMSKATSRRTNVSMDHQLDRVYSRARINFEDVGGERVNVILIAHVEGGK